MAGIGSLFMPQTAMLSERASLIDTQLREFRRMAAEQTGFLTRQAEQRKKATLERAAREGWASSSVMASAYGDIDRERDAAISETNLMFEMEQAAAEQQRKELLAMHDVMAWQEGGKLAMDVGGMALGVGGLAAGIPLMAGIGGALTGGMAGATAAYKAATPAAKADSTATEQTPTTPGLPAPAAMQLPVSGAMPGATPTQMGAQMGSQFGRTPGFTLGTPGVVADAGTAIREMYPQSPLGAFGLQNYETNLRDSERYFPR